MSAMSEAALDIATPSGKDKGTENFPVGSALISRALRPHVHAYYRWARMADDIVDNPALSPEDKVARLDTMEAVLKDPTRRDVPVAAEMRESLKATHVPAVRKPSRSPPSRRVIWPMVNGAVAAMSRPKL